MDRAMTVRFGADEMREIVKLASAAGVSQAELVRRHWRQRGSGSMSDLVESVAAVIAAVEHLGERIGEIESGREGAAADAVAIAGMIEEIRADQAATTRVLGELVRGVERWHSPSAAAAPRAPAAPNSGAPTGKRPAPAGGFVSWVSAQPFVNENEKPQERARRLIPAYNAQFDPPYAPPGAA